MSLLRRLMIVVNRFPGAKSLSSFDLTNQLFGNATPPTQTIEDQSESAELYSTQIQWPAAALKMESFQLPSPIVNLLATALPYQFAVDCFPLTDGKVIFADHSGRTMLFDGEARHLFTMPDLHKPKQMPISLFIPSDDADDHHSSGGSLYIMERIPTPEMGFSTRVSDQFEAFVFGKPTPTFPCHCQLLPPPPFVRDLTNIYRKIISYAVIGSDIYISAERAGTYRLDTVSNTWYEVGRWMLPFYGKVEYVPELKLWIGLSAQDKHFAAADLTAMHSQPQLLGDLKEFEPPEEWLESHDPQLVNLGSGKLCIARFFQTVAEDEYVKNTIVVLTGVEATRLVHDDSCGSSGGGTENVKVKLTKHKSKCHFSDHPTISAVF